MSLILKSNNLFTGENTFGTFTDYKARVVADGGSIQNEDELFKALRFMVNTGLDATNIFSAVSPSWGAKVVNGVVTKMYSLFDASGDVTSTGTFPLKQVGSKFSFSADGVNTAHYFKSAGTITGINVGLFLSMVKAPTITPELSTPIELFKTSTANGRGIGFAYIKSSNTFNANAYDASGVATSMPYANNIGGRVNPTAFTVYQNGSILQTDVTVVSPTVSDYSLYMGGTRHATLAGTPGDYYCGIATKDITEAQAIAISNFIRYYS